jgi:hypothetical protein
MFRKEDTMTRRLEMLLGAAIAGVMAATGWSGSASADALKPRSTAKSIPKGRDGCAS